MLTNMFTFFHNFQREEEKKKSGILIVSILFVEEEKRKVEFLDYFFMLKVVKKEWKWTSLLQNILLKFLQSFQGLFYFLDQTLLTT